MKYILTSLFVAFSLFMAPHADDAAQVAAYCGAQIPNNTTRLIGPVNIRNCVNRIISNTGTMSVSITTGPITATNVSVSNLSATGTISATNISTTNLSISGTLSASSITGNADGLTISPTWAGSSLTFDQINYNNYVDVRQMGVICDGAAHSINLTSAQRALNLASAYPGITVNLAPKGTSCIYGTDTTLNTEAPLKYLSNTTVLFEGTAKHNINNSDLFMLEGFYDDIAATASQRQNNVAIIGVAGNLIDTVSRSTTQQRKIIGMTNVTNGLLQGVYISTTTNSGNFSIQLRNAQHVTSQNNSVYMTPNPSAAAGGDAFHITGNSSYNMTLNNTLYGDDDACSITHEGAISAGMIQNGNIFRGNICSTYRFSGLKMFTDGLTAGARILNTVWDGNIFQVHGPAGVAGNAAGIYTDNSGGTIENTLMVNNVFDCSNSQLNTGAGSGSCVLMQADIPNIINTSYKDNTFSGWTHRGINMQPNIQGVTFDGNTVTNYLGQSVIVTTSLVTSMTYNASNVLRVDFDPSVSLVGVSPSAAYYVSTTAGTNVSNTGRFYITTVSDTGHFILAAANNISSSTDQSATTISASVVFRPGSFFYIAGAKNIVVKNTTMYDPPAFTIMEGSGTKPQDVVFQDNILNNFWDWSGFQVTSGLNTSLIGNTCLNSHGNFCIRESSNANVSDSTFIMNTDGGVSSQSRQSFSFGDADYMFKWGNVGNNGDSFNFYPFGTVSATLVSATTGTFGGLVVTGQVSATALKVNTTTVPCAVTADIGNVRYTSTYGVLARCQALSVFTTMASPTITFSPTVP